MLEIKTLHSLRAKALTKDSAVVREKPWEPRLEKGGSVPASKPFCLIQGLPAKHEDKCGHDGEQRS